MTACHCLYRCSRWVIVLPRAQPVRRPGGECQGFADELGGYVAAGGAQGAAKTDFAAAFEDRDDHDVGDAIAPTRTATAPRPRKRLLKVFFRRAGR